jgi:3-keto-5-aminohexanoate cleavage enzyme
MEKVIITAAITGSRMMRDVAPYIPITPEEIAQSAIECWQAGASIVHIHVRDPKTGLGAQDLDLFRRVVERIREKTDLILSLTTSGIPGRNLPIEERLVPLQLKPELASFDAGSINLGGSVFINTPEFLDEAAKKMKEAGVKPEIEVFDSGMLVTALRMRDQGKLDEPLHFQFVLGTPWGAPATVKFIAGAWTTPRIGRPSSTRPMLTQNAGMPCTKWRKPRSSTAWNWAASTFPASTSITTRA